MSFLRTCDGAKIGILLKTYPKLSETFIEGEISGLQRRGFGLHIFSLQQPTDSASFHRPAESRNVPVTYLTDTPMSRARAHIRLLLGSPVRYLKALAFVARRGEANRLTDFIHAVRLALLARSARITHLHAHFIDQPAGIAELVQRLVGITFSISAHAKDIYLSDAGVLRRKLDNARFTVSCTEYNRSYLATIAADNSRIHRMYHGIDTKRLRPSTSAPGAADEPPLILSVGRLREKKGFETLLEACSLLRASDIAVRCEIVGYGPDEERLRRLIARLRLDDIVELVGKLAHDAVVERYRRASAFVLPCRIADDGDRDGIPNVLLEAMAMQLPVISTAVSGIPEVIEHGENGLLVRPGDADALASAVRLILDDPEIRSTMGAAARRTILNMFGAEKNLAQLEELLTDACSARPNRESATARDAAYAP